MTAPVTLDDYLAALPEDRRRVIEAVRSVVNANLAPGYEEGMSHGMIGWYVPLERFPDTYNGEPLALAGLASQKRHMALYLNNVYGDPATEARFRRRWEESGKRLDMGKSCVRFTRLDDLAVDAVAEVIASTDVEGFIARYLEVRGSSRRSRSASSG